MSGRSACGLFHRLADALEAEASAKLAVVKALRDDADNAAQAGQQAQRTTLLANAHDVALMANIALMLRDVVRSIS